MKFREMKDSERELVYRMDYLEWGTDKKFNHYVAELEAEESDGGIRYVLTDDNQIFASLIVFSVDEGYYDTYPIFGIASLVVSKDLRGNGYGSEIIRQCCRFLLKKHSESVILLYSDIHPSFYSKLGFISLPERYQDYQDSVCMIKSSPKNYHSFLSIANDAITHLLTTY